MLNREGSSRISVCSHCLGIECGKQDSHNLPVHNLISTHFSCSTWSKTLWLPSLESYTVSSVVEFYSTSDKLRPREVLQRSSSRSVSGSRLFPGKRQTRLKRFNSRRCVARGMMMMIPVGGRTSSFGGTVDRFASFFRPCIYLSIGARSSDGNYGSGFVRPRCTIPGDVSPAALWTPLRNWPGLSLVRVVCV